MSKVAAQLYTVREFLKTAKDFAASLKKLHDIGYRAVQFSAVGCMNGDSPEVDARLARRMMDDLGIRCIATHRSPEDLAAKTDAEIAFHKEIGCDFCAVGGAPMYARQGGAEGYRRFVGEFQPVIARLKAAGIQFGYHNHAHEFIRSPNGLRPFDVLVNEGGPDLMMEIDTYWVAQAGANPAKWLRKCAGRIPVIHDKDMLVVEKNDTDMCPVGEGNLEWDEIIAACEAGGTKWHAVEQDRTLKGRDPFDCLKSSFDFLTAQGL